MKNKSYPVFGTEKPFNEVYPNIENLKIEVSIYSLGNKYQSLQNYFFTESNIQRNVPCCNNLCKNGYYDIQKILNTMIHSGLTAHSGSIMCNGYEPMGRGQKRGCSNLLKYNTIIKYKEK